jgi:pyrimidine-nucleoside phosphorylase
MLKNKRVCLPIYEKRVIITLQMKNKGSIMRIYDLIQKKKNKKPLTKEEIVFFVSGVMSGKIKDYETSALLMAINLNGMNLDETYELTMAMAHSGDIVNFNDVKGVITDKHSTGGVSDTTTLIVVPIVASLGVKVAKMSGGGLGFTGGTADKLKVFTGFELNLTEDEFKRQINTIGASIITSSKNLAPADKILYELRHLTGSVDSIPLIASSIMSKKLASNADVIVLDVKFGNGAFMKDIKKASLLAKTMVEIGRRAGKKVSALLTDMNEPLGNAIGNQLEVKSAIEVLQGKRNSLATVSKRLAEEMLLLSGMFDAKQAKKAVQDSISSGNALLKLQEIIRAQGGDDQLITRIELWKKPKHTTTIFAKKEGFVNAFDTAELGLIVAQMGGAKQAKRAHIDNTVGIQLFVKLGSKVKLGDKLAELYFNNEDKLQEFEERVQKAITIGKTKKMKGNKLIQQIVR